MYAYATHMMTYAGDAGVLGPLGAWGSIFMQLALFVKDQGCVEGCYIYIYQIPSDIREG